MMEFGAWGWARAAVVDGYANESKGANTCLRTGPADSRGTPQSSAKSEERSARSAA
jgi:hypothetical protein